MLPHWLPVAVTETSEGVLIDQRVRPVDRPLKRAVTVIRNGRMRRSSFFARLFSFTELRDWLLDAGFRTVEGHAGDGTPLTIAARRMILVAHK